MLAAIIGDTVGSVYEFNNIRTKKFSLFNGRNFLTDDSIMTLAVAEIIQNNWYDDKDKIIDTLKKWGRAYPNRGYGGMFYKWLFTDLRESYRSYGNGAAMRISPVGWYARDEEEVRKISKAITEVTHSHPEGIKGAEVTAMCIYYARKGKDKDFIRKYVEKYYNLNFDYDELVNEYEFNETCQNNVPQAIFCFLISNSFEDCIRTTISIGGDCDTTAAISCAIAEAYYKDIDENIIDELNKYIPKPKDGCNAFEILSKFRNYKTIDNISFEDIHDDTKFICSYEENNGNVYVEWSYSKSLKSLAEYIIFEELDNYFGMKDDDLSKDLLSERNINAYIDYLINYSSFDDNEFIYSKLKETIVDVIHKNLTYDKFINFINEINYILNKINANIKYLYFNNVDDAFRFLKENFDISSDIYSNVFDKTYRKLQISNK